MFSHHIRCYILMQRIMLKDKLGRETKKCERGENKTGWDQLHEIDLAVTSLCMQYRKSTRKCLVPSCPVLLCYAHNAIPFC